MLSVEICISHTSATIYCILAALCNFSATAVPFEDFIGHPFGNGAGDQSLSGCDDCSVNVELSSPFPFFNGTYTRVGVSCVHRGWHLYTF